MPIIVTTVAVTRDRLRRFILRTWIHDSRLSPALHLLSGNLPICWVSQENAASHYTTPQRTRHAGLGLHAHAGEATTRPGTLVTGDASTTDTYSPQPGLKRLPAASTSQHNMCTTWDRARINTRHGLRGATGSSSTWHALTCTDMQ
jgi:hypothetical protein